MDRDSLQLPLAQGLSVEKIAQRFRKHPSTVSYWMRKHGLETINARRRLERRVALDAAQAGGGDPPQALEMICRLRGKTDFVREGSGYCRCRRCRAESVMAHRRRLKELLVREAGGRCVICGYDRQARALEFHHLDPAEKRFALSSKGVTLSLARLRAEARKCVQVCSNCHAELEDGFVALPDTVLQCVRARLPPPSEAARDQ